MKLEISQLSSGYGKKQILFDVSLEVSSGEALCLLGANGSGKTTLLKSILGLLSLRSGTVTLDKDNLSGYSTRQRASVLGYVPQEHSLPFAYKVKDVVLMARSVHLKLFASPSKEDIRIAEEALDQLQISWLGNELYTEISGGERQLVLIARALAQKPKILILDEPTANLDFGNQVRVLKTIKDLRSSGLGMLMTTHSPDHAFLCGSHVALLHHGRLLASGTPEAVLTAEQLSKTYGVPLRVMAVESNTPVVLPVFR